MPHKRVVLPRPSMHYLAQRLSGDKPAGGKREGDTMDATQPGRAQAAAAFWRGSIACRRRGMSGRW